MKMGVLRMSASTAGIWLICVVGVVGLVTAVVVVRLAGRRPYHANPQRGEMRGLVQGGQHIGGGRSVAPTRDAPVPQGGGEPPAIEEEVAAHDARPSRGSGNPMDL